MKADDHALQRLFDETRAAPDALTLQRLELASSDVRRRRGGWRWLALAAALVIASLVWWQLTPGGESARLTAAPVTAATAPPTPTTVVQARSASLDSLDSLAGGDLNLGMEAIAEDGDVEELIHAYEILLAER